MNLKNFQVLKNLLENFKNINFFFKDWEDAGIQNKFLKDVVYP